MRIHYLAFVLILLVIIRAPAPVRAQRGQGGGQKQCTPVVGPAARAALSGSDRQHVATPQVRDQTHGQIHIER